MAFLVGNSIDGAGFGIINNGYKFTEQELSALKTVRELHYPSANTFENMIARHIPRNIIDDSIKTNFIEEKPKYEKIEIIKKEIHKRVGYAIKLGVYDEYGIAHYNYNEAANIKDHKTCNDLRLLTKKLNLINDDINNYAKN